MKFHEHLYLHYSHQNEQNQQHLESIAYHVIQIIL